MYSFRGVHEQEEEEGQRRCGALEAGDHDRHENQEIGIEPAHQVQEGSRVEPGLMGQAAQQGRDQRRSVVTVVDVDAPPIPAFRRVGRAQRCQLRLNSDQRSGAKPPLIRSASASAPRACPCDSSGGHAGVRRHGSAPGRPPRRRPRQPRRARRSPPRRSTWCRGSSGTCRAREEGAPPAQVLYRGRSVEDLRGRRRPPRRGR